MDAPEKRRWYCPTPGWLVYGSLPATGLIWLSNWLEWPAWHKGYAVLAAVAGVGVVLAAMLLWWLVALVFRWRFQFSIRSLLVLTIAVAVPCSWLGVAIRQARKERDIVAALQKVGGEAFYDYQLSNVRGLFCINGPPAGPASLRGLLGNEFFSYVQCVAFVRFSDPQPHKWDPQAIGLVLEDLKGLSHLNELDLGNTPVTDAELRHVAGLNHLTYISLYGTGVTDAGRKDLQQALPNCEIY